MNEAEKKKSLGRQILTGAFVGLLLVASCVAYVYFFISRPIAQESAQRALLAQLRIDLTEYRQQHGIYPRDLSVVRVSNFADGSSPATLQQFSYASDGSRFTLSCVGASTRRIITITSDELGASRTLK